MKLVDSELAFPSRKDRRPTIHTIAPLIESLESRVLLSVSLVLAGTQSIAVGTNYNVSDDFDAHQSEMQIAVNPTNPLNVIAISHSIDHHSNLRAMDTWRSMDGGLSWSRTPIDATVDGDGNAVHRFDPAITFDAYGTAYIAYGTITPQAWPDPDLVRLIVARSDDGGASCSQATIVDQATVLESGGFPDKWIVTTGPDPEIPGQRNIYVGYIHVEIGPVYSVFAAASYDRGETFTITSLSNSAGHFPAPTVDADGRVYIVWDTLGGALYMAVSNDAGETFSNPIDVTDSSLVASPSPKRIAAQPDRGIAAVPSIAVHDGRIYVAYVTLGSGGGDNTDVVIRYSDDDGQSWSDEKTVHAPSTASQFHPWMKIDTSSGAIGVIFYDTRNDSNNRKVEAWAAVSIDRGDTWVEVPLSIDQWNQTVQSDQSRDNIQRFFGNYLEYIGFDFRDGTLRALWADNRDNLADLEAYTASAAIISSGNQLIIQGDDHVANPDDIITVRRSAANSTFIEVVFGTGSSAVIQYAGLLASIGSITIDGGTGNDTITIARDLGVPVTVNVNSGNTVTFPAGTNLKELNIAGGGAVHLAAQATPNHPEGTLVVESLSISGGGLLDLWNSSMIIDYTGSVGTLVDDIRLHLWDGRLQTSADEPEGTRMGYGDNASPVLGFIIFAGQDVDSTSLLMKFTYGGDANLDGQVNLSDLGILSDNWETNGPWTSGDFNYDGFVDLGDLGILAGNWEAGTSSPMFMPQDYQDFFNEIDDLGLSEEEISHLLELLLVAELVHG
jgi:hypothetical protein